MGPIVNSIPETPAQLILRSLLEYPDGPEDRNRESPKRKATKDDKGPEGIVDVPGLSSALLQLDVTPQSPVESEEDNQPEQDPPPSRDPQGEQDPMGAEKSQHTKAFHITIPLISSRLDENDYRDQRSAVLSDYSNDADDESGRPEEEISLEGSGKPRQGWDDTIWVKRSKRMRRNGFSDQSSTKRKLNP